MKKVQNFSLDQSICANLSTQASSMPQTPNQKSDQKKSIPKFNRKTSGNVLVRKPSQLTLQIQSSLCFISPKKSLNFQDNLFESPKFHKATERFTSRLNQKTFKESRENLESQDIEINSHKKQKVISKKESQLNSDLVNNEKQRERLLYQIDQLKKQNKNMIKKLKDHESLKQFVMERQNFIYQISQINMKQLEQITQINKHNVELANKIFVLEKEVTFQQQKYLKMDQHYQLQLLNEKQRVQLIEKQVLKLKEQIKVLKEQNLKYNVFSLRCKQSTISIHHKKNKSHLKSKSATFQPRMIDITNMQLLIANQTKSVQDNNKQNQTAGIMSELQCISELNESDSFLAYKQEHSELSHETEGQQTQNMNAHIQNQQETLIKKLKQKIRYCQIQIDVLKKTKVDCQKIKDENQKYKALNKKYLNRIEYFSKRLSRRRSGSDSSLELSLTPKKK